MTQHLDDQLLSDLLDDALDVSERTGADAHLATCSECDSRLRTMRGVVTQAATLPRSVDVPADEWQRIRARIGVREWRGAGTMPWWTRRSALLAAGLALVMVSSGVTVLLLRPEPSVTTQAPPVAKGVPATARVAAIEDEYAATARELERELAARKHALAPETIAAVERSLRTIDAAIAEAREALARDPGSETLERLLVAGHGQKIDLLRRAARLATRS